MARYPTASGSLSGARTGPWRVLAPGHRLGRALLLIGLAALGGEPLAGRAEGNLHDCQLWRSSSGAEHTLVANRLGANNLLTKNHKLDPGAPDGSQPLYRSSDIQRLCRSY